MELSISKDEVLRYLGYKNRGLDEDTESLIEECIKEAEKIIKPGFVYKFFDICKRNDVLLFKNSIIEFKSRALLKHLEKSDSCALMAVTLGSFIDTKIRYYEKSDMTKALILDSCATAAVEEACDKVCEIIKKETLIKGKSITSRFSPGYGDLPLNIQSDFISLLQADRTIGLNASAQSILIPRKSVTAVVGLVDLNYKSEERGCLTCSKYSDCEFRRKK